MQHMGQTFFFLFISLLLVGCLGDYNRFVDIVDRNDKLQKNHVIDTLYIQKYNTQVKDIMNRPNYYGKSSDLDYTLIKPKNRNDGITEYHLSFNEHFIDDKYIDYYFITTADTNEVIGWEFLYCNKRKIDPKNKESYKVCLRDTRVIKEDDSTYRIGVNITFLEKYGYENQFKSTEAEDDLKIVSDVLNLHNLCVASDNQIVRKEYWAFGVRYKVKCLPTLRVR